MPFLSGVAERTELNLSELNLRAPLGAVAFTRRALDNLVRRPPRRRDGQGPIDNKKSLQAGAAPDFRRTQPEKRVASRGVDPTGETGRLPWRGPDRRNGNAISTGVLLALVLAQTLGF